MPPTPDENAVRAQLARILAAPPVRGSPNLTAFLQFVVDRALAGRGDEVKEYTVAVEVLGRGPDFDPRTDGVVRVQAGHLRKKLDAYYRAEGAADPVLIEIPKGGYVPCFSRRDTPPQPTPAAAPGAMPPWNRAAARFGLLGLGILVGMAVAFGLADDRDRGSGDASSSGGAATRAPQALWKGIVDGGHGVVLALGVPQFFSANGVYMRDIEANDPDAGTARLRELADSLGEPLSEAEVYTGLGEAAGAVALSTFLRDRDVRVRVLRSRLVGWDSLRDEHIVFLTSMRFRTLANELQLPHRFGLDAQGTMVDRGDGTGQPQVLPSNDEIDYATIVGMPSKSAGRRILVLQGRTTWATQAVAEYVSSPTKLAELERYVRGQGAWPDVFEVLLKVEVRDRQPIAATYVQHWTP